jgi:glutathione S-transferase
MESTTARRALEELERVLDGLNAQLGGRPYLLEGFSFADVALATLLQCVAPVDDRYVRLGAATRRVWHQPELSGRFGDLVKWRDRLYAEHRRPRTPPPVRPR